MKRVLYLLVFALLSGTSFATNLSKDIVAKVTNSREVLEEQQNQSLILEQPLSTQLNANQHYSHGSHGSHGSHSSHASHVSHFSGL